MIEVSSYEAKTHLAALLKKVKNGERVLITKHNVPIAIIAPTAPQMRRTTQETVEAIKRFRKGNTLQGLSLKKMIEEGRR